MTAVLLYDGDCRFCSSCARAMQRRVQPDCLVLPYPQVDLVRQAVIGRAAAGVYRLNAASSGRWPGGTPTVQLDRAAAVGGMA